MKEIKRVARMFLPQDYDKEEKFLSQMSLQGWHFIHFHPPVSYEFEKTQPKPYVYKLDFRNKKEDDIRSCIEMYEECGWEHVQEFRVFWGVWEYFRKESVYGEEKELFSDNESKIEMLTRIRRFYLFLGLFLLGINAVNFVNIMNLISRGFMSGLIALFIYGALISLYVKIYVSVSVKIDRLKRV